MKKVLLFVAMLVGCVTFAFSQTRPTLGVLSFYGTTAEEGDIIAHLFAMQPALLQNFEVMLRTAAALEAIYAEHDFQMTGLTDSDTIAGIGRMIGAQYVLSGSVRRLGAINLLIVTVINVETFEQVAGYYRTYGTLTEIQDFLSHITENLAEATLGHQPRQDTIAIVPFVVGSGINRHDAYTLAQILAIELINVGRFAVLPRTTAINMAMTEHNFQMHGHVADEGMALLGHAINARYVLSGEIGRLGAANLFMASILRVPEGSLVVGTNRNYQVIDEGIRLMPEVAIYLTYPEGPQRDMRMGEFREAERIRREALAAIAAEEIRIRAAETAEQRRVREALEAEARRIREAELVEARRRQEASEAEARRAQRAQVARARRTRTGRTEREMFSLSYVWEADRGITRSGASFGLIFSGLYWTPFPYFNIGMETRVTALYDLNMFDVDPNYEFDVFNIEWYFSLSPTIGVIVPLGSGARMFANALFEIGRLPNGGLLERWSIGNMDIGVSPGLSAGFSFGHRITFNLNYRHVWYYGDTSFHSAGFGIGRRF